MRIHRLLRLSALSSAVAAVLGACATAPQPDGPLAKETVVAVTASNQLLRFNAGQPRKVLDRKPITGLAAQESLVGIDYRVARGMLYGLGTTGRLYVIDARTGAAKAVASAPSLVLAGTEYGMDFNPTVDRVRVTTIDGLNLRLHPDSGAVVDGDANTAGIQFDSKLAYAEGDVNAGKPASVVAVGYTYNKTNEKLTTNYAIDAEQGTLVLQGSREGASPVVSPNTGRLSTVGSLGIDKFERGGFDIADVTGSAYLAAAAASGPTRWYRVDLDTGRARLIGTVGADDAVRGIAIEP